MLTMPFLNFTLCHLFSLPWTEMKKLLSWRRSRSKQKLTRKRKRKLKRQPEGGDVCGFNQNRYRIAGQFF